MGWAWFWSVVASQLSIPPSLPVNQSRLLTSDHSTTWSKESAYEASPDYLEDRNYWSTHLPPDNSAHYWPSEFAKGMTVPPRPPILLDPSVVGQAKELSKTLRIRRYSVFTAACALLVRG